MTIIMTILRKIRIINRLSVRIQYFLYKKKIYWHNIIRDECTPGFECCLYKHTEREQNILKNIARAFTEDIPTLHVK